MNIKRALRFTLTCLCLMHKVYAPVVTPASVDRFNISITRSPLTVAYLYDSTAICKEFSELPEKRSCEVARKNAIKQNSSVMRITSKDGRYMNANINFLLVNLHKDNLGALKNRYNLSDSDNFLLFYKGKVVKNNLQGTIARADLDQLIENTWHEKINGILAQKAEDLKQRLAEDRARNAYWGPGPYWGYPYSWGCGWNGCYAPITGGYFSVGFSSGGCC